MREYWQNLSERERWAVGSCGAFVIFTLLYVLVWSPLQMRISNQLVQLQQMQADTRWMQGAVAEIKRLQSTSSRSTGARGRGNVLAMIDTNFQHHHIKRDVTRMEQTGTNQVRVVFDEVPFDALMRSLTQLWQEHGISTRSITIKRGKRFAHVRATAQLGPE